MTDGGLCERCEHAREVVSGKGSRFLMCGLHGAVPGMRKYPPLPVLRCPQFEPARSA